MNYYDKDGVLTSTVPSSGSDDAGLTLRVTIEPETSATTVAATYSISKPELANKFISPIIKYDTYAWVYGLYVEDNDNS